MNYKKKFFHKDTSNTSNITSNSANTNISNNNNTFRRNKGNSSELNMESSTDMNLLKKRQLSENHISLYDSNTIDEGDEEDGKEMLTKKPKTTDNDTRNQISKPSNTDNACTINTEIILAPWATKNTLKIKNSLARLHNEIIDFVKYVSPSQEEHSRRENAFHKLKNIILEVYPDCQVYVFGSFVTKLYLPHADIDLVVYNPDLSNITLMNKLAKILMKNKGYGSLQVIKSAKVPLIKIVDKENNLNFDISFNKLDGVYQIKEVEKGLENYPEMRYLIFILKSMLKQRDLNETYTGGIGSFLLFCLILTFLREFRRHYIAEGKGDLLNKVLLSEYFLKFLEFYGLNFDVNTKMIIMTDGGSIVDKNTRDQSLSVISPQDNTHDIGGPVYKIKEIFGVFKNRYHFIMNYNFKEYESILKYLVHSKIHEDDKPSW